MASDRSLWEFREISGAFWRIVTEDRREHVLAQAQSPEGRFHHDGQPALYLSPKPEWAEIAIDIYVRDGDPLRSIHEIEIGPTRVLNLRDPDQCAAWGADPAVGVIPWMPERALGQAATTWTLSDLARERGAEGMIYSSRREPTRWHLVLFDWTNPRVNARLTGRTTAFPLS